MGEGGVFDYVRADRALQGRLAEGDRIEVVAVDDVTRVYWVLTGRELILLEGDTPSTRLPLEGLSGEITTGDAGVTVRLRDPAGGQVVLATFRRSNKLTDRLGPRLASSGP